MAMDKEREALVERLRGVGSRTIPKPYDEDRHYSAAEIERLEQDAATISEAIAALTAQQEPVAGRCVAPPCKCSEEKRIVCAYWHSAPPSGVREGMMRAAGICRAMSAQAQTAQWSHGGGRGRPEAFREAERAITRAAEQVNADDGYADAHPKPFYDPSAAPTPQPADGVVVPRIVTDEMRWAAENWAETRPHIYVQELWDALLAAAKEPRK